MQPPDASDDLVISTPERVAFQYEIAGIGSRFLAQVVDSLVITVILIAITILATSMGGLFGSGELALLIEIILGFILLAGYFLISEAAWNGQTLGKRLLRLRVMDAQGSGVQPALSGTFLKCSLTTQVSLRYCGSRSSAITVSHSPSGKPRFATWSGSWISSRSSMPSAC